MFEQSMQAWIGEWWALLKYSVRAQIWLGAAAFFIVSMPFLGDWVEGVLQLYGPLADLTATLREELSQRYEHIAGVGFLTCVWAAVSAMKQDRRRLLGH